MLIDIFGFLHNLIVRFLLVFDLGIWGCIGVFVLKNLYKKELEKYER